MLVVWLYSIYTVEESQCEKSNLINTCFIFIGNKRPEWTIIITLFNLFMAPKQIDYYWEKNIWWRWMPNKWERPSLLCYGTMSMLIFSINDAFHGNEFHVSRCEWVSCFSFYFHGNGIHLGNIESRMKSIVSPYWMTSILLSNKIDVDSTD